MRVRLTRRGRLLERDVALLEGLPLRGLPLLIGLPERDLPSLAGLLDRDFASLAGLPERDFALLARLSERDRTMTAGLPERERILTTGLGERVRGGVEAMSIICFFWKSRLLSLCNIKRQMITSQILMTIFIKSLHTYDFLL